MAQHDAYLTIIKLARQYKNEGRFSQAEGFYKQAIIVARELFVDSNDSQLPLLTYLSELATFYCFQNKEQLSELLWLEILELGKDSLNAIDSIYTEAVFGVACAKEAKGENEQAENLYKDLIQKQEKALGNDVLETCPAIKMSAAFYYRQGNYAQAEALYLKALALEEFHLGTCSAQINNTVNDLVNIFRIQKKWRLAEYMLDRQKDILNILHGENSLCATSCELRQAELFQQSGQIEKARLCYNSVLRNYTNMFGAQSASVLAFKKRLVQLSMSFTAYAPDSINAKAKESPNVMPIVPTIMIAV